MGKILVQSLLNDGHKVSVLSRGNEKPSWWDKINHIKADRNNVDELKDALQNYNFDWVFDFQAFRKEHVESFGNIMEGRVGKYLFVRDLAQRAGEDVVEHLADDTRVVVWSIDDATDEPWDGFRSDAEADGDALASAGFGTDEDYGGCCDW